MNRRPVCIACGVLMFFIFLLRLAGAPVFGEPVLSEGLEDKLCDGRMMTVTGVIDDRQKKEKSTQYIIRDASADWYGEKISFHRLKITMTGETSVYVNTAEGEENPDPTELIFAGTSLPASELTIGSSVKLTGTVTKIAPPGNPGQFDSQSYYACQKIFYSMFCQKVIVLEEGSGMRENLAAVRSQISSGLLSVMHAESAGVLSAMLLGDRSMLDEESRLNYRVGGVMHVLAVSGLHITLLGVAAYSLLLKLFILAGGMRMPGIMKGIAAVFAAGVMFIYCLFTGTPISAVRAYIMFLILLVAKVTQRSYDSLNALCMSAMLILIVSPGYLFYAGFQLSFAAVLGAAGLYPELLKLVPESFWRKGSARKKIMHNIAELMLSWSAVTMMTLPLTAYYFYQVPAFSLLANIFILPAMTYVMEIGAVGSVLVLLSKKLAWLILIPVDLILQLFAYMTGSLRKVPLAMWTCGKPELWQIVLWYAGVAVILIVLKSKQRHVLKKKRQLIPTLASLTAAMIFVLFIRIRPDFSLTMLDVGQGDSLVMRTDGAVFLVDGGSSSENLVGKYRIMPYLESQGISHIDGIFITHGDSDHYSGTEEMLNAIADGTTFIRVDHLYMPYWMKTNGAGIRITRECRNTGITVSWVKQGDRVAAGKLRMDVLHPLTEGGELEGNAGSLVLYVKYDDFSALLTGDLEGEGEEETIPFVQDVNYLKVGHHGSRYSTSEELLAAARPEVCAISAPKDSVYGHPHQETLDRIEAAGADAFCTKDYGAIITSFNNGKMTVSGYLGDE